MMLKTLIALAVAGAFAAPMAAQASASDDNLVIAQAGGAGGSRTEPHDFKALDTNHDGYVSRDEARNANELNTRFSELDRDNDNKLSRQEYSGIEADKRAQGHGAAAGTHGGAAGSSGAAATTGSAGAGKAPEKQPSANPRSESGTTK